MQENHPYLTLKINVMKDANRFKPKFKDIVLQFLFAFNIFESEFFEEPKWFDTNDETKKTVRNRIDEIQNLCNENNYPLELLEKFQSHFLSIYIEDKVCTERFNSLHFHHTQFYYFLIFAMN